MRPVVSDYGLFGASVKVHWLRMGSYAATGTFTSRVLDSGPGANDWTHADRDARPSRPAAAITYQTRSGATVRPGRAAGRRGRTWAAGGAIASPNARFIQYRATLTGNGVSDADAPARRRRLHRRHRPRAGAGHGGARARPRRRTNQTLTATPSGFSDPDGDPLTYRYRWFRNGTRIAGAAANTLNLSARRATATAATRSASRSTRPTAAAPRATR